jgi:hypothetical protein
MAFAANGQGTVAFGNSALTAVKLDNGTGGLVALPLGLPLYYGFFWGTNIDSLALVESLGTPSAIAQGVINVSGGSAFPIPGGTPGQVVYAQVRGWSSEFGTNWQTASYTSNAFFGETDVRQIMLGASGGPGTVIWQSATGTNLSRFNPLVLHIVTIPRFRLNVLATPGGTVTRSPDSAAYTTGSVVTVTATPEAGHAFIRWSGAATGNENPLTVTMDRSKNLAAIFGSLAITVNVEGLGSVAKIPDREYYDLGQQVTLVATPGLWTRFARWTDGNLDNPRIVTVGEKDSYTAVFEPTGPLEKVTFGDVSRVGPVGMPAVLVDDVFILTNSISVRGLARVTLSTTFPRGTLRYTIDGSDPSFGARLYTRPFIVAKTSHLRVVAYNANFTKNVQSDPLDIIVLPTLAGVTDGGGSVTIEPADGAYFSNGSAQVSAAALPGWTLLQWLGDASGTDSVVNLPMTRNKTARAMFGTTLNTTVVGDGSLVVRPLATFYPYGTEVRLTAVPAPGNYLAFWADAGSGMTQDPLIFKVTNANPTVTAVFESLPGTQTNTLTVIADGQGDATVSPPGNRFMRGTNVTLQAVPKPGQQFLGWSGDATGNQNPLIVTMNSHKTITAMFTHRPSLRAEGTLALLNEEGPRLTVTGEFGAQYSIVGTTNLLDWIAVGIVTNTHGAVQLSDPAGMYLPRRFYRAVGE